MEDLVSKKKKKEKKRKRKEKLCKQGQRPILVVVEGNSAK